MDENAAVSNEPNKAENDQMQALKVVEGAKSPVKKETEETRKMKENFSFFGPATAAYALFYAFCMYRNASGITFPFFVAGSLWYFCYSLKKLGITLKKGSAYYLVSTMLLAVSTFCTGDERIITFNALGIFLLLISFLLNHFFNTLKWGLGKYLASMLELIFSSIGELARPFQDASEYFTKNQDLKKKKVFYVLLGLLITVPIFLLVAGLLSGADAIFRQVTERIMMTVNLDNIFGVIFSIVFWFFAVYLLMANLCNKTIREEVKDHRKGEPVMAVTVTGMLSLLYLYFCWIQIAALFLGSMKLPEGYTYAEYAREGFFQLLAVAILNLIIVLFCLAFFRESKLLKGVLTVMSLCTFIMIASSAMRMILYIESYNLTFLRILVLWALAVLSFMFVGVLLCIFRENFPLFRYGMIVVTCFYLLLSFSHPDLIIAKVNLENTADVVLDYSYLSELSTDAAPVLMPYLREKGYDLSVVEIPMNGNPKSRSAEKTFGYYYLDNVRGYVKDMNYRSFNLSRYIALKLAQE